MELGGCHVDASCDEEREWSARAYGRRRATLEFGVVIGVVNGAVVYSFAVRGHQ